VKWDNEMHGLWSCQTPRNMLEPKTEFMCILMSWFSHIWLKKLGENEMKWLYVQNYNVVKPLEACWSWNVNYTMWWMNIYNCEPSGWICVLNCYCEYTCDKIW
jgi:hypothetical protein